jgi:crossover junction endodeoxyribonuclease RuvC
MRVTLGIDPGTATVGYAIVSEDRGKLKLLVCDVITTPPALPFPERLQMIFHGLGEIIRLYQPQDAAIEELFFARNARTAIAVGHGRGVAMLAAAEAGLPVSEYTPMQVKQAVQGYGSATKHQVGEMVRLLLDLDAVPKPDDAADAAAIAICHLHSAHLTRLQEMRS